MKMRGKPVDKMTNPAKNDSGFVISMADIPKGSTRRFDLTFDDQHLQAALETLGLLEIRKARITGTLAPEGRKNWRLQAEVGASLSQACVLTLMPVKARIDTSVNRLFLTDWEEPEGDSVMEMTMDEDSDPLGEEIDLEQIAIEAIAMALPPYPHAEGATLEKQVFSEPGVTPMTDEDAKPFAGLAALRNKIGD